MFSNRGANSEIPSISAIHVANAIDNDTELVDVKTNSARFKRERDAVAALATGTQVINWNNAAMNLESWPTGFYLVLQQVHPLMEFADDGRASALNYVSDIADSLLHHCKEVQAIGITGNIEVNHLKEALPVILNTNELLRHAMSEGTKALTKFQGVGNETGGLQFAHKDIKRLVTIVSGGTSITPDGAVFLAAVLEYMCAEVLEIAGNSAKDQHRIAMALVASSTQSNVTPPPAKPSTLSGKTEVPLIIITGTLILDNDPDE